MEKQEAFRERRHLHVCDLWPWDVTLTLSQGQIGSCHEMSLIVLYLGTRYDVCECNILRHMTISFFFVTFDLRLWPSSSVKVTFNFVIRWTLYCCVLVPSTKFVDSIEFEIWTIVWRKLKWRHNDVISHSHFMKFKHKSTKGISKRHTEFQFDQT